MNSRVLSRVAVFTGAGAGTAAHAEALRALGTLLGERGVGVVYGGAGIGLMGVLADAALAAGGEVVGVIPGQLLEREVAHRGLSALHVVGGMHERKALMAALADGFVVAPGGAGTLDEFFEAWTWRQLGLHDKPIGLFDVDGFFAPLLGALRGVVAQGLLGAAQVADLVVEASPGRLVDRLGVHPVVAPRRPHATVSPAGGSLVVAALLHVRDGKVLTVRARGRRAWFLPGGKPEPGEDLVAALVRECREEIGVELEVASVAPAFTVCAPAHGQPSGTRVWFHCFTAVFAGEPAASAEVDEVSWLPPEGLLDCAEVAPAMRAVFDRVSVMVPASRVS